MIKGILFDFDLTLIDSKEVLLRAFDEMGKNHGLNMEFIDHKKLFGNNHDTFVDEILRHNEGKMTWEEISALDLRYMNEFYPDAQIIGKEFLNSLQEKGVRIAILSGNLQNVIEKVVDKNPDVIFDFVMGAKGIGLAIPKDEMIAKAVDKWGFKSNEIMYVGDHPNDIIAAKKAGVVSVAIATGVHSVEELANYKPDILIKDLEEIGKHIK